MAPWYRAGLLLAARRRPWAAGVLVAVAVLELTVFARIGRGRTPMTIELGLRPDIVEAYRTSGQTRVQETSAPSNVAMAQRDFALYGYDPVMLGRYLEFMYWTQGLEAYRSVLRRAGGEVLLFIPRHADLVEMAPESATAAQELPFVRAVTPFHPAFRLELELRLEIAAGS